MKRLFFSVLLVCMLSPSIIFAGDKPFTVLTSFYPMYIMAMNVAGGIPGVVVLNLTPPVTGCLHDYALTPGDMKKLDSADVFVVNGAGMESFLEKARAANPRIEIIALASGVPLINDPRGEANPHVWVSVSGAIAEVENLIAGLQAADPERAGRYESNGRAYVKKLEALRGQMTAGLAPFRGQEIITFHEAFPYFAREFGLEVAAVVEREPGSSPNPRELAETIDLIRKTGIKILFSEPQYSSAAAQVIARETGAQVRVLDPAVTGPVEPDAYLTIMRANLETLLQALREQP